MNASAISSSLRIGRPDRSEHDSVWARFTRRKMHVSLEKMKAAPFRYHAPRTIDEAVTLLAEVAPLDGRVLAGGQSLVPIMAFRLTRPAHLVDINGVEALRRLAVEGERLCFGD